MSTLNTNFSPSIIEEIINKSKRIFFIGIGGISVSSLAKYCHTLGKEIFGYDEKRTEISEELEKYCHIKYYSSPDNVKGMDMVIYTTATNESSFEYSYAKKTGIPLISRANFLGYIMTKYKKRIGVCGMHGKSTVTNMLCHIFNEAKKNPTVFCGAKINGSSKSEQISNSEYCIFEACEYLNAFLSLNPTQSVITNIDYDHPDFFKNIDDALSSFQKYADKNERIYVNGDDVTSKRIFHKNAITYGIHNDADYMAQIRHVSQKNEFYVYKNDTYLGKCTLNLFGEHFVYDALASFCVAYENGIDARTIVDALSSFKGTDRRMQLIKKTDTGADVFIDYAHHPTEISASFASLKDMGYKSVACVFQPHTYSRTFYLYDEFKKVLGCVDKLVIAPSYSAREENTFDFTDKGFAHDCGGVFLDDYSEIVNYVTKLNTEAIIIMGAGSICELAKFF